jgi:hypothetical protein
MEGTRSTRPELSYARTDTRLRKISTLCLRLISPVRRSMVLVCAWAQIQSSPAQGGVETIEVLQSRAQELRSSTATEWKTFSETLRSANVSPEEYIRRVEQWRAGRAATLEELRNVEVQLASIRTVQRPLNPPTIPATADPLLADIYATNAEIAVALDQLRQMDTSAAEYIRNLDEFLALNGEALAEQTQRYAQLAARQNSARQPLASTSLPAQRITNEIRIIFEELRSLSPNERTPAVDAKFPSLKLLEKQLLEAIRQQ